MSAPQNRENISQVDASREAARPETNQPSRLVRFKSPLLLTLFFVIGLALSLAHCLFYSQLSNRIVGNAAKQETNLRIGTALAFLSQITFTASVFLAYTQYLWKELQTYDSVNVHTINSLFSLDTSVLAFLNPKIWRGNFRSVSAIALIAWLQILAPFFTPGTLTVYLDTTKFISDQLVRLPSISNGNLAYLFAYSPSIYGDTSDRNGLDPSEPDTRMLYGPRTIITMLESSTVSLGRILDIEPPHNRSEYRIEFFGPYIKCGEPQSDVIGKIEQALEDIMDEPLESARLATNIYYGFVPYFNSSGAMLPQSRPRYQFPSHDAINQLWLTSLRYSVDPADGNLKKKRHFLSCELWNATYSLNLHWDGGIQNATAYKDIELHNVVEFPNDKPGTVSNMVQHSYSAFAWTIFDTFLGTISWYVDDNCDPRREDIRCSAEFGVINTQLQHTSIIGSFDFDVFFNMNEKHDERGYPVNPLSGQRGQDKDLAGNRTLDLLIEELSFNTTVSLLHNPLLTENAIVPVTVWEPVNRYSYQPVGLFLPYGLAIFSSLVVLIVAYASWISSGGEVYPDKHLIAVIGPIWKEDAAKAFRTKHGKVRIEMVDNRPEWKCVTDSVRQT